MWFTQVKQKILSRRRKEDYLFLAALAPLREPMSLAGGLQAISK